MLPTFVFGLGDCSGLLFPVLRLECGPEGAGEDDFALPSSAFDFCIGGGGGRSLGALISFLNEPLLGDPDDGFFAVGGAGRSSVFGAGVASEFGTLCSHCSMLFRLSPIPFPARLCCSGILNMVGELELDSGCCSSGIMFREGW